MKTLTTYSLALGCALGVSLLSGCGPASGETKPAYSARQKGKNSMKIHKVVKSDEEWKNTLSPMQYKIARKKGTERAFTGKFYNHKEEGIYTCAACKAELFSSHSKYDSGSGWPSFFEPVANDRIATQSDRAHGMARTEIMCARCDAHLGHVFRDGPRPTGLRYCVNSAILGFNKKDDAVKPEPVKTSKATFAAGCFWGIEAGFRKLPGVLETAVGYSGGKTKDPTYKQVCTSGTGHAESVEVTYDPLKISYGKLLETFWSMHNPTQINRQGPDFGSQYRSVIFYHDDNQKKEARQSLKALAKSRRYKKRIATSIESAKPFYLAEEYHQRYLEKRGRATCAASVLSK